MRLLKITTFFEQKKILNIILTKIVFGNMLAAISDIKNDTSSRNVVTRKANVTMKKRVCSEFPRKPFLFIV